MQGAVRGKGKSAMSMLHVPSSEQAIVQDLPSMSARMAPTPAEQPSTVQHLDRVPQHAHSMRAADRQAFIWERSAQPSTAELSTANRSAACTAQLTARLALALAAGGGAIYAGRVALEGALGGFAGHRVVGRGAQRKVHVAELVC